MTADPSQSDPAGSPDSTTGASIEDRVRHLELLVRQQVYADAVGAAEAILAVAPTHREALYLLAVSQRFLGRIDDALATLARLERYHPRFTRLFQERGLCHVAARRAQPAITALLQAVNMNPALPASWKMLVQLYRMTGDRDNEAMAAAHVQKLASLPPEVVTSTALVSDGDLAEAERIIRAYLLKHGDHPEAMRVLARIGIELDVLDDAELLLRGVLAAEPGYRAARHDLAHCLLKRHKYQEALDEIEHLLAADPGNFQYRISQAAAVVGLGQHERAVELYSALARERPGAIDLILSVGHAEKTLGHQDEAIAAYRAAAAIRPSYGEAYWSLANLKTYRFTDSELAAMRAAEDDDALQRIDRYHLAFALGKAYEDAGNYAESFRYYERGNALKKAETRFRAEPIERNGRLQREVCTASFFATRSGWGDPSRAPIFVVGLPRAGSTLIEQILASHSQVEGTMELANIPRIVHDLQDREITVETPRYPGILADMKAADFSALGAGYLADTAVFRTGKPYFIDKMPNNFWHLGLIRLMLPNAKIIDARREPMACCFSNFKQLFATGQDFTYGLEDIGRYYRAYVELMDHWDAVLPGWILRVQHEDVVDDLEGSVRRILEFCELPFESGCVEFHRTERSVRTASSEQVRRPIFREGLDQWRHFEPWLGPLKAALGLPGA